MLNAKERASYEVETVEVFGKDMKIYAPFIYKSQLFSAGYWDFLAGKRLPWFRYLIRLIAISPFAMDRYILMFSGLIGPRFLCWVNYLISKIKAK